MSKPQPAKGSRSFEPGSLWRLLTERCREADRSGALHSIPSRCCFVEDAGSRFLVRILPSLQLKQAARQMQSEKEKAGKKYNPFLPYDEDLHVADVSKTHLVLLNKYNVLDGHLLIITRHFEPQESLLTLDDFEALWRCMAEFEGLAFYNSGTVSGASQRHKHLQIVPLPLAPRGPRIPLGPLLESAPSEGTVGGFPFVHAFSRLPVGLEEDPAQAAQATLDLYSGMMEGLRLKPHAYNLLATRRWLLMLPRTRGRYGPVSVNALGFAGSLVVKDGQELEFVEKTGPWTILRRVSRGFSEPQGRR